MIKRYDFYIDDDSGDTETYECDDGEWVRWDDVKNIVVYPMNTAIKNDSAMDAIAFINELDELDQRPISEVAKVARLRQIMQSWRQQHQ